jgi:hypothetical protein
MAMNNVQKNIASQIQIAAREMVHAQAELTQIAAMWANESMAELTDADFAELAEFAHVTSAEFTAAAGALSTINTAIGTSPTSPWAKLLKIVDRVAL